MLRHTTPKEATPPPVPPEIQVRDVQRLDIVFINGVTLSFDLEKDDTFKDTGTMLSVFIKSKNRRLKFAQSRVLYIETRPEQVKTVIAPK